jgi:hypothetical protein
VSSPLDRELGPGDPSPYLPRWVHDQVPAPSIESFEPDPDTHLSEQRFVIECYRLPVSLAPPGSTRHVPATRSLFDRLGLCALALAALSVVGLLSVGISSAPQSTYQQSTSFESRFSGPAIEPHATRRASERLSEPTPRLGAAQDDLSTASPTLGAPGVEWRRLPPAQDWADRNSLAPAAGDIRGQLFSGNVVESGTRDGAEDRNALFRHFLDWQKMQSGGYATRVPAQE